MPAISKGFKQFAHQQLETKILRPRIWPNLVEINPSLWSLSQSDTRTQTNIFFAIPKLDDIAPFARSSMNGSNPTSVFHNNKKVKKSKNIKMANAKVGK